jgi:hypothetical protein
MASITGGRFVFGLPGSSTLAGVGLGLFDGTNPISPAAVAGNFNIEVFTSVSGNTLPALDTGFQAGVIDNGATLTNNFLTGSVLQLFTGDYALTDSVTGANTPAFIALGTGNQSVVGAGGDTIQGGSGTQVLNAITNFAAGAETVIGGSGPTTVYGGPGNLVIAGSGDTYIDGTAGKMTIQVGSGGTDLIVGTSAVNAISGAATGPDTIIGGSAAVNIASLGPGDQVNFAGQTGNATINATVGNVGVTLGGGAATVFGGAGDQINLGSVGQYADGGAGALRITDGSAGVDTVFGSSVAGGGTTILGGSAGLNFNPQSGGGGDLINLAGSSGNATINAFKAGAVELTGVNDTIIAGNGSDSVWGGAGDRIGVGNAAAVGGTHLWDHSTSVAGAAVAFGTNDTVLAATYGAAPGAVTVNSALAGSSSAVVTVTNFAPGADSLFYQNEASVTNSAIVATATATTINGTPSSVITLPDGTVMTVVGIDPGNLGLINTAGLLFKA